MPDTTYYQTIELQQIDQIRNICDQLPSYVRKFFRAAQQTKTARTRLGYAMDIKTFYEYIVEAYDDKKLASPKDVSLEILSNLSADFVEDYMDYLQKYSKNGRIYTNGKASIKRKLSALSAFYAYFYKNDLVTQNPVSKVDMPKIREKQIVRMDAAEVANFLDTVEYGNNLTNKQLVYHEKSKLRDLALLSLMLSTGIRISECVGLNIAHVDFHNMCIKITRKGGKEAFVYFSDEASEALTAYMQQRAKIEAAPGHENALFLSSHKKRMNVRTVEKLVEKYAKCSVPLKHITPHKLRSTYGTALYQETGDIYLVADVLGHSDVNTTRKHYADMENERKRSARNKVTLREKLE